jgi:hypothetical protein
VIWPLWFAMDWHGTATKEAQALQNRQQYLAAQTEQKRCGVGAPPSPPASRKL